MKKKRDYQHRRLDQNFLTKDSSFLFRCTECGECCRNVPKEDKILLSPVDLYRAATIRILLIQDVLAGYCDMIPGGESMLRWSF